MKNQILFSVILMVLLNTLSGSAVAEWVALGENAEFVGYVDPTTIRKNGDMVKMWVLQDFKTVQNDRPKRYLSMKTLAEYNCKDQRIRSHFISVHSMKMGEGESTESDVGNADWRPVRPKSFAESEWVVACRHVLVEEMARIEKEVEAFAADPAHPFFDELSDDIAAILKTGASLAEAYEKAVWANPVTRAKEILRRQGNSNSVKRNLHSRE